MIAEVLDPGNYQASWFAVPTLLTASTLSALGLMVILRERPSRVSLSFFSITAVTTIWQISNSLMYCALTTRVANFWSHLGQLGVIFIPASVYHFTAVCLQIDSNLTRRVWLIWELSALFAITVIWSTGFLAGVHRYPWGYYPAYGWLGMVFICFFIAVMALSLKHYWSAYRTMAPGIGQLRSRGLFSAFGIANLGAVDFFAAYGIPLYPFGYLAVLGFVAVANRTIRRYRLLNITPAFAAKEIIDAMDDALLVLDSEGIVRVANRSATRIFSRPDAALLGADMKALAKLLSPGETDLWQRILNGTLRDHECALNAGAAHATVLSISSCTMGEPDQEPIASVCIVRDITQNKLAERQIQRHTEQQAALYEQTRRQAADLEKANRIKEDFLSVMSHELRTPLNVISGYTKLIQEGVMGAVNAEQNKALEKVTRHADELLFMVNSIMHATKIEAGVLAADKDEFWLSGFLDDLKPIYDYPYGKEIELVWEYPADLPLIYSDRDKLKHILQNLINNAIKFTDSGTIAISAREIDGKNRVEFVVQDTGIGIAAQELPLIFDRFRQADSSRTRTYGGVGLGLHIVKTFTELLGGSVSASSQLGKGSTFTVVIPCNNQPRRAVGTAVPRQLS